MATKKVSKVEAEIKADLLLPHDDDNFGEDFDIEAYYKKHQAYVDTHPTLADAIGTVRSMLGAGKKKARRRLLFAGQAHIHKTARKAWRVESRAQWEKDNPEAHAAEKAELARIHGQRRAHEAASR